MGNTSELENKLKSVQSNFETYGYNRYSGYYVFTPSSGSDIGNKMTASVINEIINTLEDNPYGIKYSQFPIPDMNTLDHISVFPQDGNDIFNGLDQYIDDLSSNLACKSCSNTC